MCTSIPQQYTISEIIIHYYKFIKAINKKEKLIIIIIDTCAIEEAKDISRQYCWSTFLGKQASINSSQPILNIAFFNVL